MRSNSWTEWEDKIIERHYGTEAVFVILMERSRGAIYQRARDLGIKAKPQWEQNELLKLADYKVKPVKEISARLPERTDAAIISKAYYERLNRGKGRPNRRPAAERFQWTKRKRKVVADNMHLSFKQLCDLTQAPLKQVRALWVELFSEAQS